MGVVVGDQAHRALPRLAHLQLGTRQPPAPDARLPVPPHGATGPGHLCFSAGADEIESWKARLEAKNVAIEADFLWPPKPGQVLGGRSIYFRDPSGNSLEFAEPKIWKL